MLDDLVAVIETLKVRIQQHQGSLQSNEIRTRTALIDPLLTALGWDVADPNLVTPEYDVSGKRADYGLLKKDGKPVAVLEAKKLGEPLGPHRSQMVGYCVEIGVPYAGLTDGDRWEMYDVFKQMPLDDKRVLDVSVMKLAVHQCALELLLLWRPNLASGHPTEAQKPVLATDSGESSGTHVPVEDDPKGMPLDPAVWTSLGTLQAEFGDRSPAGLRFSDGQERPLTSWKNLLVEVAEWLVRTRRLTAAQCPVQIGRNRCTVNTSPTHSDSKPFRASVELSNGLFLETHLSGPATIDRSRALLKYLDQDPAQVHVTTA